MDETTKLAIGGAVGIAAVAGIAYYMSNKTSTTAAAAAAPGTYTPSNGSHSATMPSGSTLTVNPPADSGGVAATITAGNSSVVSVSGQVLTAVGTSGQATAISFQWTNTATGAVENDALSITIQ